MDKRNKEWNVIYQAIKNKILFIRYPMSFIFYILGVILEKIDSINNYNKYVYCIKLIKKITPKGCVITIPGYYSTSSYYGHYVNLLRYSGERRWIVPYLGEIEHGVRFGKEKIVYEKHIFSYAVQGRERTEELLNENNSIPIFRIGPYINYATSYYDTIKKAKMKAKLGKTLLVFPSHSFEEDNTRLSDNDFMNWVQKNYAKMYDTVLVCVYWNDVNDKSIKQYVDAGYKLCTAGARIDRNFLARLRTIIELADFVVGDDLGTNIGYCMALNRPFALYTRELDCKVLEKKYIEEFSYAFNSIDGVFTNEQIIKQKELFIRFWGGGEELTADELRTIAKVVKLVMKKSSYNILDYRSNLKELYENGLDYITEEDREIIIKNLVV